MSKMDNGSLHGDDRSCAGRRGHRGPNPWHQRLGPNPGSSSSEQPPVATNPEQPPASTTSTLSPGQTRVAGKFAAPFGTLAGSRENAIALATALRTGSAATLTYRMIGDNGKPTTTTVTITPPTKSMGWGNVSHSLALAQFALNQAGITNPTGAQLQAAFLGGSVTTADGKTVALAGVLQQRADGMGWGRIAQSYGTTMGAVNRGIEAPATAVATTTPTAPPKDAPVPPKDAPIVAAPGTASGRDVAAPQRVTTAGGTSAGAGQATKGITTAGGTPAGAGQGTKGITTAGGSSAGTGKSTKGITTAGGPRQGLVKVPRALRLHPAQRVAQILAASSPRTAAHTGTAMRMGAVW